MLLWILAWLGKSPLHLAELQAVYESPAPSVQTPSWKSTCPRELLGSSLQTLTFRSPTFVLDKSPFCSLHQPFAPSSPSGICLGQHWEEVFRSLGSWLVIK